MKLSFLCYFIKLDVTKIISQGYYKGVIIKKVRIHWYNTNYIDLYMIWLYVRNYKFPKFYLKKKQYNMSKLFVIFCLLSIKLVFNPSQKNAKIKK